MWAGIDEHARREIEFLQHRVKRLETIVAALVKKIAEEEK